MTRRGIQDIALACLRSRTPVSIHTHHFRKTVMKALDQYDDQGDGELPAIAEALRFTPDGWSLLSDAHDRTMHLFIWEIEDTNPMNRNRLTDRALLWLDISCFMAIHLMAVTRYGMSFVEVNLPQVFQTIAPDL